MFLTSSTPLRGGTFIFIHDPLLPLAKFLTGCEVVSRAADAVFDRTLLPGTYKLDRLNKIF